MENYKIFLLFIALNGFFLLAVAQEKTDFDYKNHGSDWPQTCTDSQLHNQSPIILPTEITSDKQSYLFADFRPTPAQGVILNTTILITPTESSQISWFGELYTEIIKESHYSFKAIEIRIRTRSEHRINDKEGQKDLELQISFLPLLGKQNDKLMMGLLFEAKDGQSEDPFLEQIIKQHKGLNQIFPLNVNLNHLLSRQQIFNFWFYLGSITIPPCSNKRMNWIVPDRVFQMSKNQKAFFDSLFPDGNWRDVQPDEGNEIGYATVLPVPVPAQL